MVVARNANLMPTRLCLSTIWAIHAVVKACFWCVSYLNIKNVSFVWTATIAEAVPFLNMTRQFSAQINQISSQINSVVIS